MKSILNTTTDEEAIDLVNSFQLADINMNDELQNTIIKEVLINFNQILKITTINIWSHHQQQIKQTTAANNLKYKMKALESASALEATALAYAKATANINNDKSANLNTNLRLNNLEKAFRRQEQKTNETKNKNKNKNQKNLSGSQQSVPLASPQKLAPAKRKTTIVDLTSDKSGETLQEEFENVQHYPHQKIKTQKRQKKNRNQHESYKKSIQWKEAEVKDFNPKSPVNSTFPPYGNHRPSNTGTQEMGILQYYSPPTMVGQPPQNFFPNNPFNSNQKPQGASHPFPQTTHGGFQCPFPQYTQMQGFTPGQNPFRPPPK